MAKPHPLLVLRLLHLFKQLAHSALSANAYLARAALVLYVVGLAYIQAQGRPLRCCASQLSQMAITFCAYRFCCRLAIAAAYPC